MVLRKERNIPNEGNNTTTSSSSSSSLSTTQSSLSSRIIISNEQPVIKRQKIDNRNSIATETTTITTSSTTLTTATSMTTSLSSPSCSGSASSSSSSLSSSLKDDQDTPPDILVVRPSTSSQSLSSSAIMNNNNNNNNNFGDSTDEVDRVMSTSKNQEIPDLLRLSNGKSGNNSNNINNSNYNNSNGNVNNNTNNSNEMREFEEYLIKQCLCNVSERTLHKPFENHYYYHDHLNSIKRIANLCEWPINKLLQFLSNLQLLFDIYLKQNNKGFICSRIMDVCDAIIQNDNNNLIDEIIELCNYNNIYVQFLSIRVLSSFIVISKNHMNDNWLKKLVDNLFSFEHLDYYAVQKIHFSLDIIKRIVEWKDVDIHPLEDDDDDDDNGGGMSSERNNRTNIIAGLTPRQPSLENNYFAINFNTELGASSSSSGSGSGSGVSFTSNARSNSSRLKRQIIDTNNATVSPSSPLNASTSGSDGNTNNCHLITLTDSESFDTSHLKCITIKILENKWPALVKNMSNLIMSYRDISNSENCILTFLSLWENIISVKANLSIVETLPFYAQLDKFELLLNQNLSCTIYKQMLNLFNEALCYGSTLALQDLLPEETCQLAHQIVRHVKDFRILDSLPRRQPENVVGFIGFRGESIRYKNDSFEHIVNSRNNVDNGNGDIDNGDDDDNDDNDSNGLITNTDMDKTILQKMVLLVLKSVAVTVKEIRSDSSDSSIDSSDYDAFQDMVLIERSIRDVLKKLESFIKNTLEFHPECHFSKILIHLFDDQDDHLIEAMVCTLDVTSGISFRNNAFPELVSMLNPVYTFLEFLKMISNSTDLLLDLLVSNETCFLLYLLRFLKYIRLNWSMFVTSCQEFNGGSYRRVYATSTASSSSSLSSAAITNTTLDEAMSVLIRLRLQISRLVSKQLYPYDISPVLRLLESCENLYEGNELC